MGTVTIEIHGLYLAKVNYHRTDDINPKAPINGSVIRVIASWIAEPEEKFANEFIFTSRDTNVWIPQRDLEILREIDADEFFKD